MNARKLRKRLLAGTRDGTGYINDVEIETESNGSVYVAIHIAPPFGLTAHEKIIEHKNMMHKRVSDWLKEFAPVGVVFKVYVEMSK